MAANPSASPLDTHAAPTSRTRASGKATTAFVLGIVAVLGALLIAIVGLVLGVVAAAMGHTARRAAGGVAPWQATAGLVLGCIAILGAVANMVAGVIIAT